ncbi:MAG: hypothetical protein K2N34_10530 [Lachnospiraceae bacterium]|nr:hypothetical protein [Lachnospiraceae bacterium]
MRDNATRKETVYKKARENNKFSISEPWEFVPEALMLLKGIGDNHKLLKVSAMS